MKNDGYCYEEWVAEPVPAEVREASLLVEAETIAGNAIEILEDMGYVVTRRYESATDPAKRRQETGAPVKRLSDCLGFDVKKTYRLLEADLIPGVSKIDPRKRKSHYVIPNPEQSAERFLAGERKVA